MISMYYHTYVVHYLYIFYNYSGKNMRGSRIRVEKRVQYFCPDLNQVKTRC